ncbi:DUF6665 family protein [Mesorhizobium sp. BAC0120]|uniref:DUF6665 family protein n=1 Tax=Mesorhizobium sp. BAC0120 TaxID=3090670 RepID=UPI00298CF75D|nr:DUF6665 family protein [Mesorhizobium sp. BAC0120]MDW6022292.1 DUF6665 family protein [Mesorhizobium sp. BAC0120]
MALRPPTLLATPSSRHGGVNPLEVEIAAEMASTLGRAGEKVERSLARLRAQEPGAPDRVALLKEATEAVYAYFIQRELCGMRRHHDVIREYAIPNEVLVRLGAK